MDIFQVERNDGCPCGSGRKFKRCCQDRVEGAVRRIGQVIGMSGCTAEGREIIETLGFLSGLQAEDEGHMPDPETLGKILKEAWEEEDHMRSRKDEGALRGLSLQLQVLLGEKPYLRHIRVPVWLFDSGEDDEDFDIIEYLAGTGGYLFVTEAVESIRLSLLYDDYTEDEVKILLAGLGWLVVDDTRGLFFQSVLYKTRCDLLAAGKEASEIFEKYGDENKLGVYEEIRSIFQKYPVYKRMLSADMLEGINPAVKAISQGEIKINVPLYSVLGGIYAIISGLADSFTSVFSRRGVFPALIPPLEDVLLDGGELIFFFPEVVNFIGEAIQENQDGELESSLGKLLVYLTCLHDEIQVTLLKLLYMRCICTFLDELPLALPEAGVEFDAPKDFCDGKLIQQYAGYLESQGMAEEAGHVRDVFQSMGEQARVKAETQEKELVKLARALFGEVPGVV
ncbi:MAG: SEC-C domain-containing protein [Bacillota bacterium]|nr:SEC-C domain-containing protein [Bacillota bacterium]